MLEKGPVSCRAAVLQILLCMAHYLNLTRSPAHLIDLDLLRTVAKCVEVSYIVSRTHVQKCEVFIKEALWGKVGGAGVC